MCALKRRMRMSPARPHVAESVRAEDAVVSVAPILASGPSAAR
jgi:hypothetical protein